MQTFLGDIQEPVIIILMMLLMEWPMNSKTLKSKATLDLMMR